VIKDVVSQENAVERLRQIRFNTVTTSSSLFEAITRAANRVALANTPAELREAAERIRDISTWTIAARVKDQLAAVATRVDAIV
jgi:hypothetical protein